MKFTVFTILISLAFIKCSSFSDNADSKDIVIVNHVVNSELPLICENDMDMIPALTSHLLSNAKLDTVIKKAVADELSGFYLTHKIMSAQCFQDEVFFPKKFFRKLSQNRNIDSIKIVISRDFKDMSFNGYGFIQENGNEIKTQILDTGLNKWSISNNSTTHIVKINEDPKTKNLFLTTEKGDVITFPAIKPSRLYISDIKFIEHLKVFYSDGHNYSDSINSDNIKSLAHLLRLSENLNAAKVY